MKKWLCLMLSMVLIFGMTGCGTGQDEGLVLTDCVFTDISAGSKTFKAGFGKDQVLDIAVSGDMVYYLAVKDGAADGCVSLCSFDMAKTERQTLFTHQDGSTCGMLQITDTTAFWAKSTDKGVSVWKYDFAEKGAEDTGILLNVDKLEDVKYGAFMDQVYCFVDGDLQMWNGSGWTMIDSDVTEPANFFIENGKFGAANGDKSAMQLYDAQAAGIVDTLDVSSIGMKKMVQANEFYAVWINQENKVCVYAYETGEAFDLGDAGEDGWEISLFGKYLVYKGAQNPLSWYDLENSEMMSIYTDVSKVNVVYANAEGIWRDLQTANELIVIK